MSLTFYDAACYIEQAETMDTSAEDQLRIDELFNKAMASIIELLAVPRKPFGKKWSDISAPNALMSVFPSSWGVSIHRKPQQAGEAGAWTCTISMTDPKTLASLSNSVSGRAPTMEQAVIAAILRVGQHLEINSMTDPTIPIGPLVA